MFAPPCAAVAGLCRGRACRPYVARDVSRHYIVHVLEQPKHLAGERKTQWVVGQWHALFGCYMANTARQWHALFGCYMANTARQWRALFGCYMANTTRQWRALFGCYMANTARQWRTLTGCYGQLRRKAVPN